MSLVKIVSAKGKLVFGAKGDDVKELQNALRRAGHELVVDGDFGEITKGAVERFQATVRIAADGIVGPVTAAFLDAVKAVVPIPKPLPSVLATAPWLSYARALTGTKEIPGAKSNPLILSWVRSLAARYPELKPNINWYVDDDTPWCGLGCAEFVGECDPGYMPPRAPLRALNWETWGVELDDPLPGAILVKKRTGGGHVTLAESIWEGKVYCRGANQSNMINVAEYKLKEFHAIRWPANAPIPKGLRPIVKKFNVASGQTEA